MAHPTGLDPEQDRPIWKRYHFTEPDELSLKIGSQCPLEFAVRPRDSDKIVATPLSTLGAESLKTHHVTF